jgi:hypothetical protein
MTLETFNTKWKPYFEPRFDGASIAHEGVLDYLDKEFTKEIAVNPDFNFAQIKLKFGTSRVYAHSLNTHIWEQEIDKILDER